MEKQEKKERISEYRERKKIGGICGIRNTKNGKVLLTAAPDLRGFQNRFEFAQKTGSGLSLKLQRDWDEFGAEAFRLEVLEELEQKETQTPKEFSEDLKTLLELRTEQMDPKTLY
ncbi:GIY-YIG nuclease family protein [Caproiciproducens sp. NJN-50]|uniref:GIY-YIG nuclease family protein n=1 Tax=Acutalibacteraceae TaxID=3082771 RepID=UPI000FFE2843|nr:MULTISPECIES: GIY-YIG nuclease family protein [Acutalibacteraceae]QAT48395.1 GIY-YIG nuclease family protein [Caproiciproducens sp. NJN-50]